MTTVKQLIAYLNTLPQYAEVKVLGFKSITLQPEYQSIDLPEDGENSSDMVNFNKSKNVLYLGD